MSEKAFEKYGVYEDQDNTVVQDTKTAQFNKERYCPWCGKVLISSDFTNVLICPEHGTAPFEIPPTTSRL